VSNEQEIIEARYSEIDLAVSEFDHPYWTTAPPIRIERSWSGEPAPVSRHAEARIIWSAESLLVRFVCNQIEPLIGSSNPQLTEKTIGLWDRDVCEIFIAPDISNPNHYFEFEAAPTGEWVDLAIELGLTERKTDAQFESGMTTAARIAHDHFTITICIPWSNSIPLPQLGDTWRCNLFRCVGFGNQRYLAWLPTHAPEPNFHLPEKFGWLRFG
jgi:hypothetical protein